MFPKGVSAYVDLMQDLIPGMKDGTVQTAIDTGCGVSLYLLMKGKRIVVLFLISISEMCRCFCGLIDLALTVLVVVLADAYNIFKLF